MSDVSNMEQMKQDENLLGNEKIEEAIRLLGNKKTDENLAYTLTLIRKQMKEKKHFVVAVDATAASELELRTITLSDGRKFFVAFTTFEEQLKGKNAVMSSFTSEIEKLFRMTLQTKEVAGMILNPNGAMMMLDKTFIQLIVGA